MKQVRNDVLEAKLSLQGYTFLVTKKLYMYIGAVKTKTNKIFYVKHRYSRYFQMKVEKEQYTRTSLIN